MLAALLLAGAAGAVPWRARATDRPQRFDVDVTDFDWIDAARSRPVPARLHWPRQLPQRAPLIVFSHGIGGSRAGYRYLGRHWAAHGWASLHVQHVGSDRSLWGGNPLSIVQRLHDAAHEREAIARAHDVRFALDRMLAAGLPDGTAIDPRRIVAAGHSYGANTTLLVSGAQVERDGRLVTLHDPRFAAAVLISAPPFYGERDPSAVLRHVRIPTLHVTATEDVIRIPGYWSGAEDRVAIYEATGSPHKALVVFDGGSHSVFTDRAGTGGVTLNPLVKEATRELALAFFRATFDGEASALSGWRQRYQPLVAHAAGALLAPGTLEAAL